MPLKAVFFDVGETLLSEARQWSVRAQWLGIPPHSFFAALGAVIERREHHRKVFEYLGVDFEPIRQERRAAGESDDLVAADFYPDAIPCLRQLRSEGYRLGISGNQPAQTDQFLQEAGLPVDFIASSTTWGIEKPDPAFFRRISRETGLPPEQIAYVGDRLDNDVLPALEVGMKAIFIRRGPWGYVHANWPEAGQATACIETLSELVNTLSGL